MIEAAAEKVIDFSLAKPFDRAWHRHRSLLLDYVSRRNRQRLLSQLLEHRLGLLTRVRKEDATKLIEAADDLIDSIGRTMQPWRQIEQKTRQTEAKQLISAWEQQHGSLQSKVTQEAVARTTEALLASMTQTDVPVAKEGRSRARSRKHSRSTPRSAS